METIKHTIVRTAVIGAKTIISAELCEVRLVNVLKAIYAVTIQAKTFIIVEISSGPIRPARRRMIKANRPKTTAETMLATLKFGVKTSCRPPQAIETGRMPAARSS